mgnify:CR=1 FL=1
MTIYDQQKYLTQNTKDVIIKARVDKELQSKLDFCSKKLCVSKSYIIRNCIEKIYLELKNRKD